MFHSKVVRRHDTSKIIVNQSNPGCHCFIFLNLALVKVLSLFVRFFFVKYKGHHSLEVVGGKNVLSSVKTI